MCLMFLNNYLNNKLNNFKIFPELQELETRKQSEKHR